jgi:LmbE family N-acetylglucosaminyl deacetylase
MRDEHHTKRFSPTHRRFAHGRHGGQDDVDRRCGRRLARIRRRYRRQANRRRRDAILVRVGNDEKESWGLSPEETALRNRNESEAAAKLLGVKEVVSFGYRSSELRDVPHTTMRDRIMFLIRHHRPAALFFPNPHTEHDRNLDRYYVGAAAEDAWHCARYQNFLPAAGSAGLAPHIVSEFFTTRRPSTRAAASRRARQPLCRNRFASISPMRSSVSSKPRLRCAR